MATVCQLMIQHWIWMSKKDRALEPKQFPIFNNFYFQRLGQFSILATLNFGNFQFWQLSILAIFYIGNSTAQALSFSHPNHINDPSRRIFIMVLMTIRTRLQNLSNFQFLENFNFGNLGSFQFWQLQFQQLSILAIFNFGNLKTQKFSILTILAILAAFNFSNFNFCNFQS